MHLLFTLRLARLKMRLQPCMEGPYHMRTKRWLLSKLESNLETARKGVGHPTTSATTAEKKVIGKYRCRKDRVEVEGREGGSIAASSSKKYIQILTHHFFRAAQCKEELTARRKEVTEGRCFTCGEKGHKRTECTSRSKRRRYSSSSSSYERAPRRRGRRRSASYSDSYSRSPSYERAPRRRHSRDYRRRSYSRSSSPRRRRRTPDRQDRDRERDRYRDHRSERRHRGRSRRRYSSSRSRSPEVKRRDRGVTNMDESNTAITTSKQV